MNWDSIILSLFLTVLIYSLPICIYRYGIRKEGLSPKKSIIVTVVYAVAAYIAMLAIKYYLFNTTEMSGGAIFLWGFINYKMLSSGYIPKTQAEADHSEHRKSRFFFQPYEIPPKNQYEGHEEIHFTHTCTSCGHTFKVKYKKPVDKKEIPTLSVTCPKCQVKNTFKI